jgi:acetoin utilization protein AcuB
MKTLTGITFNLHFQDLPLIANDVMRRNPRSIHRIATMAEAAEFLTNARVGAAPVIDDAGRPMGVVSRTDIVRHLRTDGVLRPDFARNTVSAIMNPRLFFVLPNTPIKSVINKMLRRKVHRLFVIDQHGVLVGVVSALDVLRGLKQMSAKKGGLRMKSVA